MYSDKHLEFMIASRDAAADTTRSLPMGARDMTGDTRGMGPYNGLFIYISAGADVAAGLVVVMEHADTETGIYTAQVTFPATTTALVAGEVIAKFPVPFDTKNWVRFTLTPEASLNILMTRDVEKEYPGLRV